MRLGIIPALCLGVLAAPVQAQTVQDLIGSEIQSVNPVVLYDTPQATVFKQRRASGIVEFTEEGANVVELDTDGAEYVVSGESQSQALVVTGTRKVVNEGQIQQWLQVTGDAGQTGWVNYQTSGFAPALDIVDQQGASQ